MFKTNHVILLASVQQLVGSSARALESTSTRFHKYNLVWTSRSSRSWLLAELSNSLFKGPLHHPNHTRRVTCLGHTQGHHLPAVQVLQKPGSFVSRFVKFQVQNSLILVLCSAKCSGLCGQTPRPQCCRGQLKAYLPLPLNTFLQVARAKVIVAVGTPLYSNLICLPRFFSTALGSG